MNKSEKEKMERKIEPQDSKREGFKTGGQDSFDEKIQDLDVKEKEGVIKWRTIFSKIMMWFLLSQYVTIIILLIFQGFNIWGFNLDNYIFYILIFGTFAQSCFLVQIIFKYVFSYKK